MMMTMVMIIGRVVQRQSVRNREPLLFDSCYISRRLGGSHSVLQAYKPSKQACRNRRISSPRGAETAEPILTKLGTVDSVQNATTTHSIFGGGSATLVDWSGHIIDLTHLKMSSNKINFS